MTGNCLANSAVKQPQVLEGFVVKYLRMGPDIGAKSLSNCYKSFVTHLETRELFNLRYTLFTNVLFLCVHKSDFASRLSKAPFSA